METIKLSRHEWRIDTASPLGRPGGFGQVFLGEGKEGNVAIKRLKLSASEAAHRELKIGAALRERTLRHVVPVLDIGQDANSDRYYIVMPVCQMSLQDALNKRDSLSHNEAFNTLVAILEGLEEVKDITHRDLKPANILLHEGVWKIADFGIAKFVEESTSLESLRSNLTPAYAAPEQWKLQRPTASTDIYAVGCIAHALISGNPPYTGNIDTLREQHLSSVPPIIAGIPPAASSIISMMLRKSPEIRPKAGRCIELFKNAQAPSSSDSANAISKLAQSINSIASEHAAEEARKSKTDEIRASRESICAEAISDLQRIKTRLFSEILIHGREVAERTESPNYIRLGKATLLFNCTSPGMIGEGIKKSEDYVSGEGWGVHRKRSNWDIIAFSKIAIEQRDVNKTYKREANLVFGRHDENSEFRWYEVGFFAYRLRDRIPKDEPFALDHIWEIDQALSPALHEHQLAYQPTVIDGENENSFLEYWIDLTAQAAIGELRKPSSLPMAR